MLSYKLSSKYLWTHAAKGVSLWVENERVDRHAHGPIDVGACKPHATRPERVEETKGLKWTNK